MNPYERLAQQIEAWDARSGNANKRRLDSKKGFERWEEVRQAFKWLVEVDDRSSDRRSRQHLLDALWAYMILPDISWNNPEGRTSKFGLGELGHLHTLAEQHTVELDHAKTLSPQELTVLRETMELIKSDLGLYEHVLGKAGKRLETLVDSCLTLLEQDEVDDAAVRARTEQIFGAVIPASFGIEDEKKRRGFVEKAAKALGVWVNDFTANASGSVAGQLILGIITG